MKKSSQNSVFAERLNSAVHPAEARPKGRINPALLQFNTVVKQTKLAKDVRRWIYNSGLAKAPASVPGAGGACHQRSPRPGSRRPARAGGACGRMTAGTTARTNASATWVHAVHRAIHPSPPPQ